MRQQPLQPISPSIEAETGLAGGSDESGMVIEGTNAEDEGVGQMKMAELAEFNPHHHHMKFQEFEKVSSPAQVQK